MTKAHYPSDKVAALITIDGIERTIRFADTLSMEFDFIHGSLEQFILRRESAKLEKPTTKIVINGDIVFAGNADIGCQYITPDDSYDYEMPVPHYTVTTAKDDTLTITLTN